MLFIYFGKKEDVTYFETFLSFFLIDEIDKCFKIQALNLCIIKITCRFRVISKSNIS